MIENIAPYITVTFIITTLITLYLFYKAVNSSDSNHNSYKVLLVLGSWLILQAILSFNLVYAHSISDIPPLFPLGFVPPFVFMLVLFNNKKGKAFIDGMSPKLLTFLSIVRIPVELVLLWLFLENQIPEMMTFEGRNFDIIIGITAPIAAYYGYSKKKLSKVLLLVWNIIGLLLLTNIVLLFALSFPTFLQQLNIGKPILAMMHFPFFLLPSFIVPIVYFSHFANIRHLLKK